MLPIAICHEHAHNASGQSAHALASRTALGSETCLLCLCAADCRDESSHFTHFLLADSREDRAVIGSSSVRSTSAPHLSHTSSATSATKIFRWTCFHNPDLASRSSWGYDRGIFWKGETWTAGRRQITAPRFCRLSVGSLPIAIPPSSSSAYGESVRPMMPSRRRW